MSEEQLSQDDREHIDSLSRLDLCRIYRFAPTGHKYFIKDTPAADYFNKKFKEAGGFSPEISKQLGWST